MRPTLTNEAYWNMSYAQLLYIAKDAGEAAKAMQGHNMAACFKYEEQVCDAHTVLNWRRKNN